MKAQLLEANHLIQRCEVCSGLRTMIKCGHAPFPGFRIVRRIGFVYFICWGLGQMQTAATANESDWKHKPYLPCLLSQVPPTSLFFILFLKPERVLFLPPPLLLFLNGLANLIRLT